MVSIGISRGLNAVSIVASILNEASAMLNIVVSDSTTAIGGASNIGGGYTIPTGGATNPLSIGVSTTAGYGVPTEGSLSTSLASPKSTLASEIPASSVNGSLVVSDNMTTQSAFSRGANTPAPLVPLHSANSTLYSSHTNETTSRGSTTSASATIATLPKFTLNFTLPSPQANLTKPPSVASITSMSCPTSTPCYSQLTSTCFITETWHSTHYESTATLYSFMNAITITCTETVRQV